MKKRTGLWQIVFFVVLIVFGMLFLTGCDSKEEKHATIIFMKGTEKLSTVEVSETSELIFPEAPDAGPGYEFKGWMVDMPGGDDVMFEPDAVLDEWIENGWIRKVYAKYEAIVYSITYHDFGGKHANVTSYTYGKNVRLQSAEKAGYSFQGWYLDEDYSERLEEFRFKTGDISLYAKYKLNTYSITYEGGGNLPNDNPLSYTVEDLPLKLTNLTKLGYEYHWEKDGKVVDEITVDTLGDQVLRAVARLNTYRIEYYNLGNVEHSNILQYNINTSLYELKEIARAGYVFLGWYTEMDGGDKVESVAGGSTGNLELYARWEVITYTATFMVEGEVLTQAPFTIENLSVTEPIIPQKECYTSRWQSYSLGTSNITIWAIYEPIVYQIVYEETQGVSNNNPGAYTFESETISLIELERIGYVFEGWYQGEDRITEISAGSNGSITLTARWTLREYVITYVDARNKEHNNPTSYTITSDEILLQNLTDETYYFDGWYRGQERVQKITADLCTDIQLTAKWKYKITSVDNLRAANSGESVILMTDLDLQGAEWTPVENAGEFDGNGHIISNFKITQAFRKTGFFEENKGVIQNLRLENFYISMASSIECSVGGLVGYNQGTIRYCSTSGSVSASFCGRDGIPQVGGLVGLTGGGTITNCYAEGSVQVRDELTGYKKVYAGVGGFVGDVHSTTIRNCYSTCQVTHSNANYTQRAQNGTAVGGFAGGSSSSTIVNCYATGNVSGYCNGVDDPTYGADADAGAFICFGGYGTSNCYYEKNQSVSEYTNGVWSNGMHICATAADAADLQSAEWVRNNLWGEETGMWIFDGGYPTLNYEYILAQS